MIENPTVDYKELYERLENAMEEAYDLLLFARADCQEVLENSGERKALLSLDAERRLDMLVGSLRLSSELNENTDYKKMYLTLFNAITGAIQNLEWKNYGRAKDILIQAQQEAEEIYISGES